jgi:hypothetical protein
MKTAFRREKIMREKFKKLLKDHGIFGIDDKLEDIIYAVSDMLVIKADDIELKEPYATVSIKRLRDAASEVTELTYELD